MITASPESMFPETKSFSARSAQYEGGTFMNLDKIFHLKENHTDVKTEVMAGITTFMTMAYILAVNPNILSASGMDPRCCLYRNRTVRIYRNLPDGSFIQLPVRSGSRHGSERILHLHSSPGYGIYMAAGTGSSICRRYHFYFTFSYKCT